MALKDVLKKWTEDKDLGPERRKLADKILKDCDDEETAGLLNRLLEDLEKSK